MEETLLNNAQKPEIDRLHPLKILQLETRLIKVRNQGSDLY